MNNHKPLHGICAAVVLVVPLSVLASCSAISGDRHDTLLLDLNYYSPMRAYTLSGNVLTTNPELPCAIFGHIRDLTSKYVLHDEGFSGEVHPDFRMIKTRVRDFSGKLRTAFPKIPTVNDLRLAHNGNEVVFSACLARELGECRCGLALARSGTGFERLWCAPGEYHSQDQVSWSPDDKQIVFSFGGSVYLMDVVSRQTTYLARGDAPRWSPAGHRIALTDRDEIIIIDPRTRKSETHSLVVHGIIATGLEWSPDSAFISVVHRTLDQPRDSRVRTALGILDTEHWQYRDLGVRLWGDTASLRWVNLPPRNFDLLAHVVVDPCKDEPTR